MKMDKRILRVVVPGIILSFTLGVPLAFAKGKGGGTPEGFGKGEKKGWEGDKPPGWAQGEKKGWGEAGMPPGLAKKSGEAAGKKKKSKERKKG